MKLVGPLRKLRLRGRDKLWWLFTFTAAAFNIWRIPKFASGSMLKRSPQVDWDSKTAPAILLHPRLLVDAILSNGSPDRAAAFFQQAPAGEAGLHEPLSEAVRQVVFRCRAPIDGAGAVGGC